MHFRRVILGGFRNLEDATIELSDGVNLFVGENGQGKTNFLEALFVLATTKSFREAKRSELTRWAERKVHLQAAIETAGLEKEVQMDWGEEGRVLRLNGHRVTDLAQYFSTLRTVCFSPEDLELLSGAPTFRRRFLDRLVFQSKPTHALLVQQFQRVLKQRNALLRRISLGAHHESDERQSWDEQLLRLAAKVTSERLLYLACLNEELPTTYPLVSALAAESGILSGEPQLRWRSPLASDGVEPFIYEQAYAGYQERLARQLKEECRRGSTLWGPHLEDFVPCYGAKEAASFASMGQRKTFLLAVRLSQLRLVRLAFDQWPTLLLDDLSAELDAKRLSALVQALAALSKQAGQEMQTLVTSVPGATEVFRDLGAPRVFSVRNGKITK